MPRLRIHASSHSRVFDVPIPDFLRIMRVRSSLYRTNQLNNMTKARGFTLIELVIVIVLLGILGVLAASKMISLRKESLVSTLYGMRSAIEAVGQQTYALAAVRGLENSASASVVNNTQTIPLVYGYPAGGVSAGLSSLIEFPAGDWHQRASVYAGAWVYWHGTLQEDAGVGQCYLRYRQATAAGKKPVMDIETSGCK